MSDVMGRESRSGPESAAGGVESSEAVVRVRGLIKQFRRHGGDLVNAVDGVDLDIGPGEMVVLLGPSGCGKTTLLRSLVGLETPDSGSVSAMSRTVFSADDAVNVPPEKRGISMMFQQYALWPHMSVGENVEYPLASRRVAKGDRKRLVLAALEAVALADLIEQYPHQLSGGQQQRVALARSLVVDPKAVVFDEPLSNVDARVRQDLRVEILAAQSRVGFAGIYVTHDQAEAMQMATRLAVMREGKIVQIGTPEEIYSRPTNRFVATFVGSSNILDVESVESLGGSTLRVGTAVGMLEVPLSAGQSPNGQYRFVAVRPEAVAVVSPGSEGLLEVTVETVMFSGWNVEFTVVTGEGRRLRGVAGPGEAWMRPGDRAVLRIVSSSLRLLED